MTPKKKIFLALALLILTTMACEYLPTPGPEATIPQEDVIATSVTATIIAGVGEVPTAEPAEPTAEPALPTEEATPEVPVFLRIAYVKNGDVWYWEEGSAATQLTTLGDVVSVRLSSDGLIAAFVRQYDWNKKEIYAVNTDGSNVRLLVSLVDFDGMVLSPEILSAVPYRIAWAPGTHTLSFNTRMILEGPGLYLGDGIRQVDADSGLISLLMAPETAGDFYYSPDGSKIAITKEDLISVVDADGSNRLDLLAFPVVITYSEYNYYPAVTWSADSTFLRASIPPANPLAVPPDPTTIWHVPADGTPPSPLTTIAKVAFFQDTVHFSPNGEKIAYLTEVAYGLPTNVRLHIANADGSGDVVYNTGDMRFEAWSTDGEHFIFTEAGYYPKVGRIGDPPLDLLGITLALNVSWVDGTRFLYINNPVGGWELWLRELGSPGVLLASTTSSNIRYDYIK